MPKTEKRVSCVSEWRTKKKIRGVGIIPGKFETTLLLFIFLIRTLLRPLMPRTNGRTDDGRTGLTDWLTDRHLLFFQGDFSNVRTQLLTQLGILQIPSIEESDAERRGSSFHMCGLKPESIAMENVQHLYILSSSQRSKRRGEELGSSLSYSHTRARVVSLLTRCETSGFWMD